MGAVTVVLAGAAGALDAVTFFVFNEVFASTMTGNLAVLGLGLGLGRWLSSVEALCAVAGYVVGLMVGTIVAGLVMHRLPWRTAVATVLVVELVVLVTVGIGFYGFVSPEYNTVRAVVLVTGGAAAMGIQAAGLRYVGPAGTPTNFLTGTVTNLVSAMVELHRPSWDSNSVLRIAAFVCAAGGAAVVQRLVPGAAYVLPVVLVAVAVGLMARVVRVNHGGLLAGGPQFRDLTRLAENIERGSEHGSPADAGHGGAPVPAAAVGSAVCGRVVGPDGLGVPAVVTLLDDQGRCVARRDTDDDGRYHLRPTAAGVHTIVGSPDPDQHATTATGGAGGGVLWPRATTVTVSRPRRGCPARPVVHDLTLQDAD